MADKTAIAKSKIGTHVVPFQPGGEKKQCTVKKVRGEFVWVEVLEFGPVRLNRTASAKLLAGDYRS